MTPADSASQRLLAAELDAHLGKALLILDEGFIRVIDYIGTNVSIELPEER